MIKKILTAGFVLFAGSQIVSAQNTAQAGVHQTERPRFKIEDRVRSQRERIALCLKEKTITAGQASYCRGILSSVEHRLKAANDLGHSRTMAPVKYKAYNATLDANSALLHESKLTFFYYDAYYSSRFL